MKFICSRQILTKALNTVSKAVTLRTTIPILKGILLDLNEEGILTLSASDMEISIEKRIKVEACQAGSIVVVSKLFNDIIRKLPEGAITIERKEDNKIFIKSAGSEFNIIGIASEEFPKILDMEDETYSISFYKNDFTDMIKKTSFAASIDESKGVITGVLTELEAENINMVALDGFRMSVVHKNIKNAEERKIIINSKIINEIRNIIGDSNTEEAVNMQVGKKKAIVEFDNTMIVIKLLEGDFIKYKDIIPENNPIKVIVNRSEFLESIERASLLAKEGKNNLIKISVQNNLMKITSRSEEGNVKEEITVEKEGENIEIGFNSRYLIDAVKVIDDESISLAFNTSTSPCLITPLEGNEYEYLILPVRISR